MMPDAARDEAAPAGLTERLARLDAAIDRFEDATAALEDAHGPDVAPRLTRATAAGREVRAEVAAAAAAAALTDSLIRDIRDQARREGFEQGLAASAPRRGRHASASLPARALRVVTGIAGAVGLTGALRHVLGAGTAAKVTTASLTAVILTGGAVAVIPGASGALHFGVSPAGTPAPVASIEAAVPIAPPLSVRRLIASVGRPDARSSAPAAVPPLPVSSVPPPPVPPSPAQAPATTAAGTLQADVTEATLPDADGNYSGTVNLSATGGLVTWHATCPDPDVIIDGSHVGTLDPAGQPYALTFSIDPAAQAIGGSAVITLWPGDIQVEVTWAALPVPSPSPVVSDTSIPTPTAS